MTTGRRDGEKQEYNDQWATPGLDLCTGPPNRWKRSSIRGMGITQHTCNHAHREGELLKHTAQGPNRVIHGWHFCILFGSFLIYFSVTFSKMKYENESKRR
jgi:hypothetical protein